jgi:hypothetical protein
MPVAGRSSVPSRQDHFVLLAFHQRREDPRKPDHFLYVTPHSGREMHVRRRFHDQNPVRDISVASCVSHLVRAVFTYQFPSLTCRRKGYNTTYVVLGLSVFLSKLAQEPLHMRPSSECFEYIQQSLEILDAMEECSVALKISQFAKEVLTALLNNGNLPRPTQKDPDVSEPIAGFLFTDATAFFPGFPQDGV